MNILKRPMFFAAIACCTISAGSLFSKPLTYFLIIVALLTLLIVTFKKQYKYLTVFVFISLFICSLFLEFAKIESINDLDGDYIRGEFVVVEDLTAYDDYNNVVIKEKNCDSIPNGTKIFLFDYKKTKLKYGDVIDVTLRLNSIKENNKYRISNFSEGIYATANTKTIVKLNKKDVFYKSLGDVRQYVKKNISARFSGDKAGLLLAITTGDKCLLSEDFSHNIKTTGISHVIVVSGMHLSIIMAAIFLFIDKIFYNKYVRCILSIFVVFIIYSVCGFTASITRAGAMFVVAGIAPIFNRDNDSLSSLLTAITIIIITAPFIVLNVSFLLSVVSTLAIIWIVPFYLNILNSRFNIKSLFLKAIIGSVLCSFIAVIFTLPIIIKVFGYVSIVGPITNLIINIPITIALISNIIAVLVNAIPIIHHISFLMFHLAGLCSQFCEYIVNQIAKLPVTVAVLPKSAFWWSIFFIALIIGYMYYYEYKKKRSDFNANSI